MAACALDVTRDKAYLPFIPMDVSYGVDEIFLPESDDGTSDAIPIDIPFPFGNSTQSQFYVSVTFLEKKRFYYFYGAQIGTNGILSFGTSYNTWSNQPFPGSGISNLYLVAPFWDDVDIRGGNGEISYEIHQSGYFLEQVNSFLQERRPSDFQGTWMAVIYWNAVHPYFGAFSPEVSRT